MTSSNSNHLSEVPLPNTLNVGIWGLSLQHMNFWETYSHLSSFHPSTCTRDPGVGTSESDAKRSGRSMASPRLPPSLHFQWIHHTTCNWDIAGQEEPATEADGSHVMVTWNATHVQTLVTQCCEARSELLGRSRKHSHFGPSGNRSVRSCWSCFPPVPLSTCLLGLHFPQLKQEVHKSEF